MFKFTLTIATSVVLLMSGAADLFAMEFLGDESKALTINHTPKEVIGLMLEESSKNVNPRLLASVCKDWYNIIRENNSPQMAELHYSTINPSHSTMNPFMQKCMNTYWEGLFYNGVLKYTPGDGGQTVSLKFSDFKDGTFDLSACGNIGQYLVITENMNQFCKIGEENKDKTVIGIMPRHKIQQEIKNSPDHPFTSLMAGWDADEAPVGIFWRWGNDTDLSMFDYLIIADLSKISLSNLYDLWGAAYVRCEEDDMYDGYTVEFSCQFLNRNKD